MKILAVDDDPIILELLKQFIPAVGNHDLTTADSGHAALELLNAPAGDPFDCFLFDIQMPGMDGVELTQSVKSIKVYQDTPILMLTAMSEKRYIDAAFAAGATDYVTKPFEVAELRSRLDLVHGLVKRREASSKKIFAANAIAGADNGQESAPKVELYEPFSIYDVDNVIDHMALENYIAQLSRSSLFGSTVFAFAIRQIDAFHAELSNFEFCSLISDIAEVVSDTLVNHQFLMSYAGNGIFVCITDGGWRPNMEQIKDYLNLALSQTEIYNNSGELLEPRVDVGEGFRLVWKTGNSLMESLAAAHTSAEEASMAYERDRGNIWLVGQSA